jgi:hypothetical protein
MDPMACLGGEAIKTVPLLPQRILGIFNLRPRELDIAYRTLVGVHSIAGDTIVFGSYVGVGADDDIGQVRSSLGPLPMDNKVFTILYSLVHITVGLETTVCGVEGKTVGDLFVKWMSRICSEEQESDSRLPIFAVHNILVGIALSWDTGCQKPVYIDMFSALYGKLPVILIAVVPGQLGKLLGYPGHNKKIVLSLLIDRL